MDPIRIMVMQSGEEAKLISPVVPQAYDPTSTADFSPDEPSQTNVRGVPDRRVDRLPAGCVAIFTFLATKLPPGLAPDASTLEWRSTTWRVGSFRERYWRGRMNGVTLYLKG